MEHSSNARAQVHPDFRKLYNRVVNITMSIKLRNYRGNERSKEK